MPLSSPSTPQHTHARARAHAQHTVYFSPEILHRAGFVTRGAAFGITILIGARPPQQGHRLWT